MKKALLFFGLILLSVAAVAGYYLLSNSSDKSTTTVQTKVKKVNKKFSLFLANSDTYIPNVNRAFQFTIKDGDGNKVKNIKKDIAHLIIIRKDLTNMQHILPTFDNDTDEFNIESVTFNEAGSYRVFAEFSPEDAPKDDFGRDIIYSPYVDIQVGAVDTTAVTDLGTDKLTDSTGSLQTEFSIMKGDGVSTDLVATPLNLSLRYKKDGLPFTNLQSYLGGLGHMVIFDTSLNYLQADVVTDENIPQSGLVIYQTTFPKAGQYKLYVQTKAGDVVSTSSFSFTAK